MPTKYTATASNGQTFTRTTATRKYAFAVASTPSKAQETAFAQDKGWRRTDMSNFDYYTREIDPASRRYTHSEEKLDGFRAAVAGHASAADYAEAQQAARLANVEERAAAGAYDRFGCDGWCGRRDLAEKLAAKQRHGDNRVEIIEAKETGR